jgi:trigger factor
MKVEVENLSNVERRVHIEVPWETIQTELNEAYKALGKRARVKGFRPGKVPRKVLEQLYKKTVEGEVISRLVDESFRKAVEEQDLFPIDRPVLDEMPTIEAGAPLEFAARVEVKPEVDVEKYEGLDVEKTKVTIEDAQVEQELNALREKAAVVEPISDRTEAQTGDLAVVDFFGYIDGETFKGGKGINYTVELGGGEMIPGFENAIVGMKVGEEKQFNLSFPEGSGPEEVQGKEVEWKVDLKELKKKIYPEIDDEFAQDLGEYDSLDELKAQIRENLATREDARSKRELRDEVLDALVEANPIEVPDAMVDRQLSMMLEDAERAVGQSQDPKIREVIAKLREDLRPQAQKRVAGSLLLESVARKENVEATDDDVQARIGELAREHRMQPKQVEQQLRANGQLESLRHSLVQEKALDLVLDRASVTEKEPEPESEGAPDAP